jgi:hypothetical protein
MEMLQLEKMAERDGFRLVVDGDSITAFVPKDRRHYACNHSRMVHLPSSLDVDGKQYSFVMRLESRDFARDTTRSRCA